MPRPSKQPSFGPTNDGPAVGPLSSPGLARDTPIVVVDPFTMSVDVRRLDSILEGRTFANPEEEAAFLAEVMAGRTNLRPVVADPNTPLGRAQSLVYDALKADDPRKREQPTRRALRTSKDCADAWVLLAQETAEDAQAAAVLYEEGVRAGERALGEAAFIEYTGNFWSALETRPYMRARQGLALAL